MPKRQFGGVKNLQPGMQFQAQTSSGEVNVITVKSIQGDMVTIDGNHELAGKNLNFDVEITEVRDATEEELAHGHVHGAGRASSPLVLIRSCSRDGGTKLRTSH